MSTSLASIEKVVEVKPHSNADKLSLVTVLGYQMVVAKDIFKTGELVIFIQPDTVLPDNGKWDFYKAKSKRVKAIRLRGETSFGICEKIEKYLDKGNYVEGQDIAEILGVTKYESPNSKESDEEKAPQFKNNFAGRLKKWHWMLIGKKLHAHKKNRVNGFSHLGICKTDEERFQNYKKAYKQEIPYGEIVDVTEKFEGQSASFFIKTNKRNPFQFWMPKYSFGILGRTTQHGEDADNNYTKAFKKFDIKNKLIQYREKHGVDICLRGELVGANIQNFEVNWRRNLPLGLGLYSVWLIDEKRYAKKGEPHYYVNVAKELGIETVTMLEENVVLTPELIKKYSEDLKTLPNGKMFEGAVIKGAFGSFKIINLEFDSRK